MVLKCLLIVFILFSEFSSWGLGQLDFGPEFTFSDNPSVGEHVNFNKVVERMRAHLVDGQPAGEEFKVKEDGQRFESPNGWWFKWVAEGRNDRHGAAMEFKIKPGSVEYFRQFKDDMQDAIFVSAANDGLFPAMFRGGGHINLSVTVFDSNILLRNFVVDLINHNELFMGVLGYDTNNALPFHMLAEESIEAVYKVIQDFDNGKYPQIDDQKKFAEDINDAMDKKKDQFADVWPSKEFRFRFHGFNLSRFKDGRFELRGVRPQVSMDMWIRQIDLFAHRLKYLETIKNPIPIAWKVPLHEINVKTHLLQLPIDAQDALRAFYEYVTESGLPWSDHRDYLWPKWVTDGELKKFEESQWFRQKKGPMPAMVFGPEFTFSDLQTGKEGKILAVLRRLFQHLVIDQPEGQKFTFPGDIPPFQDFTSPNGWWFKCHPEGNSELGGSALEVKMIPATVEYFRHFKNDMQDAIFASAANEGMFPALYRGGGHINLSTKVFENDSLLLRNFIVDLINHNELFMGVLGYDTNNALPFHMLPKSNQLELYKVIEEFDVGDSSLQAQQKFVIALQKAQNLSLDPFWGVWHDPTEDEGEGFLHAMYSGGNYFPHRGKHHALNFNHVDADSRIEIRAVRPQMNMDMWIRQIDLIEHRMQYLEKINTQIPILWKSSVEKVEVSKHRLNPPISPQNALRAFYQYVTESGLKWSDYSDFLWPKWVADGEVAKFQGSQWFQDREAIASSKCSEALLLGAR